MVRVTDLLTLLLLLVGVHAGKMADCSGLCGGKMSLECCDCIGCHQGMRFGKRSAAFTDSDRYSETLDYRPYSDDSPLERLILERLNDLPEEHPVWRLRLNYYPL